MGRHVGLSWAHRHRLGLIQLRRAAAALAATALVGAGLYGLVVSPAAADTNSQLQVARDTQANCRLLVTGAQNNAQRIRAQFCVGDQQRIIDLLVGATPSPTPSATPTPTVAPTTAPPPTTTVVPTTVPPTPTPTATTPPPGDTAFCAPYAGVAGPFPDEHCTGWRHTGVTLHVCGDPAGSATHLETANAVYESCLFRDAVVIQAENITIRDSWVQGTVYPHDSMRTASDKPDCKGLKLIDVEVAPVGAVDPDRAGVGNCFNKSLLRVNVHGTASGIHVSDFNSVIDSYSHDFADTGSHGAAAGTGQDMGNHSVIAHNNLNCSRVNAAGVPDPSIIHCSAALSLYDEPTLTDVDVERNLFNTVSGFCAYGGNTGTSIRFNDNIFGRRYSSTCGPAGPITVFLFNAGNVWNNNRYIDGTPVNP